MTATEQKIGEIFEGTIEALARFDLERLLALQKSAVGLAGTEFLTDSRSLREKQDRLKRTLDETRSNLAVLTRLCSRKEGERWDR